MTKIPKLKKITICCEYCLGSLIKNSPNHIYHKVCKQEFYKFKYDTLENDTEKQTWKYKKPGTIHRSSVIRRNNKLKQKQYDNKRKNIKK